MIRFHRQRQIGSVNPGFGEPEAVQNRRSRMAHRPPDDAGKTCPTSDLHQWKGISLLRRECAAIPQEAQQFEERQPKNRKITPFDPSKELDPSSLEPVTADRPENRRPLSAEIGVQKRVAKVAHRQSITEV